MGKMKCNICEKEITRDRYCFAIEGQRQDFPPEGKWGPLVEIPTEDICGNCFDLIIGYFRHIMENIRKNKGEYKTSN